jgi:hypothetical protein
MMSKPMRGINVLGALLSLMLLHAAPAGAATKWYVQNWGVDSLTCGPAGTPCRSISKAIGLAAAGDTVLVGPGVYSDDLDGDMVHGEPGEETTPIVVNKPLTIVSTHGTQGTVIAETNPLGSYAILLAPASGKVVFGVKDKGFTIAMREGWHGIVGQPFGVANITIAGNTVVITPYTSTASYTVGIEYFDTFGAGGSATIKDNQVIGHRNSDAATIDAYGMLVATTTTINNVIDHNSIGNCSIGFLIGGGTWTVTNNTAGANFGDGVGTGFGFALTRPSVMFAPTTLKKFANNNATFNTTGIDVEPGVTFTAMTSNVMVANQSNCGLRNHTGGTLALSGNFWGELSGPGADPADNFCNVGAGSVTTSMNDLGVDKTPKQHPKR